MKNTAILTHQNDGLFNLNGQELSREELTLFFDLLGFQVDYKQDDAAFFENAQISLQEIAQQEFDSVFEDFMIWKRISDVQHESQIQREKAYVVTV